MIAFGQPNYEPELRSATSKTYLEGNKGDKVKLRIKVFVKNVVQATSIAKIDLNVSGYPTSENVLRSNSSVPVFSQFNVGDLIDIRNTADNNISGATITEKISSNIIRIDKVLTSESSSTATVVNITPPKRLDYYFNLVENNEATGYISKADLVSTQLMRATISGTGTYTLGFIGNKSFQLGSANVKYLDFDADTFVYEIEHDIWISPLFYPGTFDDVAAGLKESFFQNTNCLKHIFKVRFFTDPTNPNNFYEAEFSSTLGNTGGFDENFNSGSTNYSVDDITITDYFDEEIDSVDLPSLGKEALIITDGGSHQTNFSFKIKNTTDSPFTVAATKKVVLKFFHALESNEIDTAKTIKENNVFDRIILTSGASATNGENYGTLEQVFKTCTMIRVDNTTLQVSGKIAFTSAQLARLRLLTSAKPILSVGVFVASGLGGAYNEDFGNDFDNAPASNPSDSNDTALLLVLASEFVTGGSFDTDLLSFTSTLAEHPDSTVVKTSGEFFPGDGVVFKTIMAMNTVAKELNQIFFNKARMMVVAEKSTGEQFNLDEFTFDFGATTRVSNLHVVSFLQDRNFILPSGDVRRQISIQGHSDGGAGIKNYTFLWPILFRWEYWQQVLGAHADFYNTSLPNNGHNHFWYHFQTSGWSLKYRFEIDVTNAGTAGTYEADPIVLSAKDYNSNADWGSEAIELFNTSDVPLTDGSNQYVQGDADTKVKATFVKASALPALSNISGVIWMQTYEGVRIGEISSLYDFYSGSVFKSVDGTPRLNKLNPSGTTITFTCLIDYTKLPGGVTKFKIYARIFNAAAGGGGSYSGTVLEASFDVGGGAWTAGSSDNDFEWFDPIAGNGAITLVSSGSKSVTVGDEVELNGTLSSSAPAGTILTFKVDPLSWPQDLLDLIEVWRIRIECGGGSVTFSRADLFAAGGDFIQVQLTTISSATTFKVVAVAQVTRVLDNSGYIALTEVSLALASSPVSGTGGEEIASGAVLLVPQNLNKVGRSEPPIIRCSKKCPFKAVVLAETIGTHADHNDKSAIHFFGFQGITNIQMVLQKAADGCCDDSGWGDVADLNNNDFGIFFGLNFVTDDWEKKYAGYLINWQLVLLHVDGGVGRYRIVAVKTPAYGDVINEPWPVEFCLMEYTDFRAEGTVIIRTKTSGLHGKIGYPEHVFAYGSNWVSEFRFKGIFGFNHSGITEELTIYRTGQLTQPNRKWSEKFKLELLALPGWMHNVIMSEIMQASEITISDFNSENSFVHDNTPVLPSGPYEPVQGEVLVQEVAVTLELKSAYDNQTNRIC